MKKKILMIAGSTILSTIIYAQNINIQNGWQLLGASENLNVSQFDNSCVDYIWKFNITNIENPQWQIHFANGQTYNYNGAQISSLNDGIGFWVKGNNINGCNINTNKLPTVLNELNGKKYYVVYDLGLYNNPETQLNLITTGNELDIAIKGKGFSYIELPNGTKAYTRNGAFKVNSQGLIINEEGYTIIPEVIIPNEGIELIISKDGYIRGIKADGITIVLGQLVLSTFQKPIKLLQIQKIPKRIFFLNSILSFNDWQNYVLLQISVCRSVCVICKCVQ